MKNYIVINGREAELTKEQLKKLGIKIESSPFDRLDTGDIFYNIGSEGKLYRNCESKGVALYDKYYETANYCTDKELMKQRMLHEILNRLLWRFACENGELENKWDDENQHYFIYYHISTDGLAVGSHITMKTSGIVYFSSIEIAEEAIKKIIKPFMKEHPDFVW